MINRTNVSSSLMLSSRRHVICEFVHQQQQQQQQRRRRGRTNVVVVVTRKNQLEVEEEEEDVNSVEKNRCRNSRRDFMINATCELIATTTITSSSAALAADTSSSSIPFCGYYQDNRKALSQAAYQSTFSEGYVSNFETFVRQVGKPKKGNTSSLPVLVLHDTALDMKYMEAIEILAFTPDDYRREIFFYDQLNRGKSKHSPPQTQKQTSLSAFLVDELASVRRECGLAEEGVHIIAHGSGCQIALSYALNKNNVVHSLTLMGAGSSTERNKEDFECKKTSDEYEFNERYWTNRGKSGACFQNATTSTLKLFSNNNNNNNWDINDVLESNNNEIPASLRGIRVLRGVNDYITSDNAFDLVSSLNSASFEKSKRRNALCSFDNNIENAASCVHLDRAEYFLDTTSTYIRSIEDELFSL